MMLRTMVSHMQKNEPWPPSYTGHQNELKIDKRHNIRPEIITLLKENMGDKLLGIHLGDDFPNLAPKAKATEAK